MRRWLLILLSCTCFCFSGCSLKQMFSTVGKMGQIMWDPSTPVGEPQDQPSEVTVSLFATDTVNPNPNSIPVEAPEPQPLTVTVTADTLEELREQMRLALNELEPKGYELVEIQERTTVSAVVLNITSVYNLDQNPSALTNSCILRSDSMANTNGRLPQYPNRDDTQIVIGNAPERNQNSSRVNRQVHDPIIDASASSYEAQANRPRELGEYSSVLAIRDNSVSPLVVSGNQNASSLFSENQAVATEAFMTPELAREIATPVMLRVIQLKDDSMFLSTDYDTLNTNIQQALGTTYIGHDDYVLNPGQFKFIPEMEISKYTRFIAVYAQFNMMEGATWKGVIPIEPRGHRYNLMISLNGNIVTIQPDRSTAR